MTLPIACDFESFPLEIYTFPQDIECGERLNDRFEGGDSLFPSDVMAEVAEVIRLERSISRKVATQLLEQDQNFRNLLAMSLKSFEGLLLNQSDIRMACRDHISLTSLQKERASISVSKMRSTFFDKVGMLAVRRINKISE